jgi:hypothetical protein
MCSGNIGVVTLNYYVMPIMTHVAAATPNFLSCIVMLSRHVNQHLLEPSLLFRAPVCILLLNQ